MDNMHGASNHAIKQDVTMFGTSEYVSTIEYSNPKDNALPSVSEALQIMRQMQDMSGPQNVMPLTDFQFWHSVIIEDNVDFIRECLSQCDALQRNMLLNGRFQYEHSETLKNSKPICGRKSSCIYELPVVLACSFLSHRVLNLFLENGCNIRQQDSEGNNIIHAIISSASIHPLKDFSTLYRSIVEELHLPELKTLLYMENNEGYRPLEYAAKMQTFDLVDCILKTRDVYAIHRSLEGVYERVWYDVTDYEANDGTERQDKSPLLLLTQMTREGINHRGTRRLLCSPLLTSWMNFKKGLNAPSFWIWFFFRVIYHSLVFLSAKSFTSIITIMDNHAKFLSLATQLNYTLDDPKLCNMADALDNNLTDCESPAFKAVACQDHSSYVIVNIVAFVSIIMVLYDMFLFIIHMVNTFRNRKHKNFPLGGETISTMFYLTIHSLLNLSIVFTALLIISKRFAPVSMAAFFREASLFMFISTSLLNIWSLLFFFQILPFIGHFVITIQKMLADMVNFFTIFLIFLFGFSQAFCNVLKVSGFCGDTGFDGFVDGFYSTFTVMLNMIDFSKYIEASFMIALLHIAYVLFVAVLLLNFLIALMSSSVMVVNENRDVLMKLQKLHISLMLEHHVKPCARFMYARLQKRHLVLADGRVYIPCLEILEK